MKKFVYFRYEKKYRNWIERLWISLSEEELKKEIEEDGPDGYEADSTGRRPGWVKLLSYYIHTGQASMDMDISIDTDSVFSL